MKTITTTSCLLATAIFAVHGFAPGVRTPFKARVDTKIFSSMASAETDTSETNSDDAVDDSCVRAPLKYIGPYPCLGLRFPELSTKSQRTRNETGISLDFVVDTAANTNTINGQVAKELGLDVVGSALPGLGAQGAISGGDTYMLGDAQLEGVCDDLFMTQLTAAALPVANPATAGLLSLAFLYTFPGGVEFTWGAANANGTITTPPSIAFYAEEDDEAIKDMVRVPIEPIPVTNLPSVTVEINGVTMPTLLDTGSPITVMNAQAAKVAGVDTSDAQPKKSNNPFSAALDKIKAAQAAANGDVLAIMDGNGKRVELRKSLEKVHVALGKVDFGKGQVYVGDLPGLAAMNAIGVDSPPAVVLGMDVLRTKPKMLLRAQQNEVYF